MQVPLGIEVAQGHVVRKARERRTRSEPHELGLRNWRTLAHACDQVRKRHRVRVVHVQRDLCAPARG